MKNMNFRDQMFETFKSYRESDMLCDVTIQVEKQSFQVDKLMLAAASTYFKTLFTIEMKEKNQKEIVIKDVASSAFRTCLDFIYTGDGHANSIIANVDEVLHAACMFQLWDIKDRCVDTIKNNLSLENCLRIWMLAKKFVLTDIEKLALKMISRNAETILERSETLTDLCPDLFHELLISDQLVVLNEGMLFTTLLKWVQNDTEQRNEFFCKFYQLIKLPMVSKDYFRETIMKNDHVYKECVQCSEYSSRAIDLFLGGDEDCLGFTEHQLRKRKYVSNCWKNNNILVVSEENFQTFNFIDNKFSNVKLRSAPVNVDVHVPLVTLNGNKVYAADNISKKIYVCDFQHSKKWKELPSMLNQHSFGSLINFGKKILVAGGFKADKILSKAVESFEIETSTWTRFAELNVARASMATVSFGREVYTIGGNIARYINDSGDTIGPCESAAVECYDFVTNKWNKMPSLHYARKDAAAEFYNGKLFVVGGYNSFIDSQYDLNFVETYQKGSDCWNVMKGRCNIGRAIPGLAVVDNKFIAFGGYRESLYETLDYDEWKENDKNDPYTDILCESPCRIFVINI